jgi:putative transposase
MRNLAFLFVHLLVVICRLARPGGIRSVIAESVLVKHQLLILNRSRKRAPNLRALDRIITGLCALLMRPTRVIRCAIVLRPSTVFHLHRVLVKRKYRLLFSPKRRGRPGPRGPQKELVDAILEMKRRNPKWGCPRIAQQISLAFGIEINKDVVRRILSAHYSPDSHSGGPSWLTFIGHMKDSLWSVDLFRCESAVLRTYWVLVVMDQFTRRIIGFGVQRGVVDGLALCRMFNSAIRGQAPPKYVSSDHDPLYRFQQWQANLRVLDVTEVKTVPYVPLSHPFIERLIGTIRRECLDRMLFWTARDLEAKLLDFQRYFNKHRTHSGLNGRTPESGFGVGANPTAAARKGGPRSAGPDRGSSSRRVRN